MRKEEPSLEFNALVPELIVTDLGQSLDFYIQGLGFKIEYQREAEKFVYLSLGRNQLMLEEVRPGNPWATGELSRPFGRGVNFQMEVEDAAALLQQAGNLGYPVMVPLKDRWRDVKGTSFGDREFLIQDPDGYLLRFSQTIGPKTD